jgi:hypothetical protein
VSGIRGAPGLALLVVLALPGESRAAQLKGVQFGTVTIAGMATSATVTLPNAIDTTKAFLLFGISENTNTPTRGALSGQISSATTLAFARVNGGGVTLTVKWYVAEFTSGVNVRRGAADMSAVDTLNVNLGTPVNLASSFPIVSWRAAENTFNDQDFYRAKLTSTTNLELSAPASFSAATEMVEWQVVEYTGANVRTGDVSFTNAQLSRTVVLAPAAIPANSLLLYTYSIVNPSGDDAIGDRMVRGLITGGGSQLTFDRSTVGAGTTTITLTWYLIEFSDGTTVQQGSEPFAAGVAQRDVAISPVNMGRSVALAGGHYARGGRTPYTADDVAGMSWFNFDLTTPTNLRMTRGATTAAADVGWFVVSFGLTTAVELMSFEAAARDGAVELSWRTGSELDNLGFHLHRSLSAEGPYAQVTPSVIPGLGSSPEGASYRWVDAGLLNGVTYFYKLEDIETTGKTKMHGPVWAIPQVGGATPGGGDATSSTTRTAYGDPSAVSLRVLERTAQHALLELRTGGFYAVRQPDGTVLLEVPGMEEALGAGLPALPVRRASVDAVVGKGVQLAEVRARGILSYSGLVPALAGSPEMVADGTDVVQAHVGHRRARSVPRGLFPATAARLAGTAFQGEMKKALVELWPLRWNASRNRLELTRRLLVRLEFEGQVAGESSRGGLTLGRRAPRRLGAGDELLASLVVTERGLHVVSFEELFPSGFRRVPMGRLRLSRQGEPVAFHAEPAGSYFGPGSILYFFSEGRSINPYGNVAVYQLALSRRGGLEMPLVSAFPSGDTLPFAWRVERWEQNASFQPGLLDAPDLWLWQSLIAPAVKSHTFALPGLHSTSEPSQLTVFLQGGSDEDGVPDHHVRLRINGTDVGDATWDGKTATTLSVPVATDILQGVDNVLEVESLGDAGATYSLAFLDRFEVVYPRALSAPGETFEAGFSRSGTAEISGLGADSLLLDVTSAGTPAWLFAASPGASGITFRAENGRRYLAVPPSRLLRPEVRSPLQSSLRSATNRADYLLIAPRAFLAAAQPLLDLRAGQGLAVKAAALDEVYQEFGHGEATPHAIREFIAHAYHFWQAPSPRYVVLLGDASYDYQNVLGGSAENPVPPLLVKTSFLWTASDPSYAAVNGEDLVPDLALGRLPAATVNEAQVLVEKIVAFESAGRTLADGPAVLVADNPDPAGDFEASAHQAAALLAPTHTVENVFLGELGGATRPTIAAAFDRGASLVSYLGHGGIVVWASENVFNNQDVPSLAPQSQQPLLLTMNCLNGYFHFPFLNALAEELMKATGKGAIASFAPSGMSLHDPADVYHQALIRQLTSGAHERLGDAVFAAQVDFTQVGAFPELLSIYHLFGDPALKIR